jgi:hypothetical protein
MRINYNNIRIHEFFSTTDVSDIYLFASTQPQASSVLSVVRQKRTTYLNGRALTGSDKRKHCRRMCKLVRIVDDEQFVHTHTPFPCSCKAEVDIEIERLYVAHKIMLKSEQQKRWKIGDPEKELYRKMYRIGYWQLRKELNDTSYKLFREKTRKKAKLRYDADIENRRKYAREWYHANRERLYAQRRANNKSTRISKVAIPRPNRRKAEMEKKKTFAVKHTSVTLDFN